MDTNLVLLIQSANRFLRHSTVKKETKNNNNKYSIHEKDMTLIASLSSESTRFDCPSSWYDCIIKYRLIKRKKNSRKTVPTWYDWSIFFWYLSNKIYGFSHNSCGCCRFCMCLLTHALLATTSKFIYEVKHFETHKFTDFIVRRLKLDSTLSDFFLIYVVHCHRRCHRYFLILLLLEPQL